MTVTITTWFGKASCPASQAVWGTDLMHFINGAIFFAGFVMLAWMLGGPIGIDVLVGAVAWWLWPKG